MRWLLAILPLLVLASDCRQVQAQTIGPTMRGPLGYVQLHVVSGKLKLVPRQAVRTRSSTSSSGPDRAERITVDLTGLHPAVDYVLTTSQLQLAITIRNQSQFRIVRELRDSNAKAVPFEFQQSETGSLSFTWGGAEAQHRKRFSTLWHLLLMEPEAAKAHLLPILEFFHPGWNLAASTDRITQALFTDASLQRTLPRERWMQLVAQLSDNRFARREAADRQLRTQGRSILAFLDALPDEQLDFEQRQRIEGIRRALTSGQDVDAPESIAAWLGSDPRVWLALMNHADAKRRKVAADQLARLLGEEVVFDPAAPHETRLQQILELRKRIDEQGT